MTGRRLLAALWLVCAIVACERTLVYIDRPVPSAPIVDTVVVQRPGAPPDTIVITKHDTTIVTHYDTVTVMHTDTVRLHRVAAFVCLTFMHGDTLFALSWRTSLYCDAAHMAPQFPTATVAVNADTALTLIAP